MNIVLVCGGRDFSDRASVDRTLNELWTEFQGDIVILQGGSRGADRLAKEWARSVPAPYITVMADWKNHGTRAGPLRNQQMIDQFHPTHGVAFSGGRGTADMVRRLKSAGVQVWEVQG